MDECNIKSSGTDRQMKDIEYLGRIVDNTIPFEEFVVLDVSSAAHSLWFSVQVSQLTGQFAGSSIGTNQHSSVVGNLYV